MPIYEYICDQCSDWFEVIGGKDDAQAVCPFCKSFQTTRIISITYYRNADHWERNMLGGLAKAKEKDKLKAEMKTSV